MTVPRLAARQAVVNGCPPEIGEARRIVTVPDWPHVPEEAAATEGVHEPGERRVTDLLSFPACPSPETAP